MKQTGKILRIEKISLNDGPGMRTVVFFKGCPLRCAWCSTPESQKCAPEVYYQPQKCVRCGKCVEACTHDALSVNADTGLIERDYTKCVNCFDCVKACLPKAQGTYGQDMTVKQVMKYIHRDEVFFFHSGGGVTLSGGDILMQADFAQSILKECWDSGIHTMAELDLFGAYENVAKLLPYLNAFYVDLKLMDPEAHKKWTGQSNETILANLRRAAEECNSNAFHVRVPLIWDVNDSEENILQTAEFCRTLPNCAELEFLPYHRLGQATYGYLGRDYPFADKNAMSVDEAEEKLHCLVGKQFPFPVRISGNAFL